jgi:hypothetical protein
MSTTYARRDPKTVHHRQVITAACTVAVRPYRGTVTCPPGGDRGEFPAAKAVFLRGIGRFGLCWSAGARRGRCPCAAG